MVRFPILSDLKAIPVSLRRVFGFNFLFILTRAIALPYTVIFLSRVFSLNVQAIGLLLSSALIIGIISSIFAGQLIDRFGAIRIIFISALSFAVGHLLIAMSGSLPLIFLLLVGVNAAYSIIAVAIKTAIGDAVCASSEREKLFSLRYTLINIGFAIGPFIGAALAGLNPRATFMGAGLIAIVNSLLLIRLNLPRPEPETTKGKRVSSWNHVGLALRDRRLIYFTIAGVLCSLAMRQFPSYLSQYLVKIAAEDIYRIINYVSATNSFMVILFQYTITKHLVSVPLKSRISLGFLFLAAGITGFMLAHHAEPWIAAMIIFSIGEIILVTVEFAAIDHIAPERLRGSYYAVQNLSTIGGGITPVLCGVILLSYLRL
ncbi:MAG: MFS transporter [Alphaproteobacteria bacterium]